MPGHRLDPPGHRLWRRPGSPLYRYKPVVGQAAIYRYLVCMLWARFETFANDNTRRARPLERNIIIYGNSLIVWRYRYFPPILYQRLTILSWTQNVYLDCVLYTPIPPELLVPARNRTTCLITFLSDLQSLLDIIVYNTPIPPELLTTACTSPHPRTTCLITFLSYLQS